MSGFLHVLLPCLSGFTTAYLLKCGERWLLGWTQSSWHPQHPSALVTSCGIEELKTNTQHSHAVTGRKKCGWGVPSNTSAKHSLRSWRTWFLCELRLSHTVRGSWLEIHRGEKAGKDLSSAFLDSSTPLYQGSVTPQLSQCMLIQHDLKAFWRLYGPF